MKKLLIALALLFSTSAIADDLTGKVVGARFICLSASNFDDLVKVEKEKNAEEASKIASEFVKAGDCVTLAQPQSFQITRVVSENHFPDKIVLILEISHPLIAGTMYTAMAIKVKDI